MRNRQISTLIAEGLHEIRGLVAGGEPPADLEGRLTMLACMAEMDGEIHSQNAAILKALRKVVDPVTYGKVAEAAIAKLDKHREGLRETVVDVRLVNGKVHVTERPVRKPRPQEKQPQADVAKVLQ